MSIRGTSYLENAVAPEWPIDSEAADAVPAARSTLGVARDAAAIRQQGVAAAFQPEAPPDATVRFGCGRFPLDSNGLRD